PSVLDAVGLPPLSGVDGRSFIPILLGQEQSDRDHVITCYGETSAHRPFPMRCVQNAGFGYIYNAWSDGKTNYQSEPMGGLAFAAMKKAAATNPAIDARVQLLVHRVPEELYDFQADPDCLHNLIDEPAQH